MMDIIEITNDFAFYRDATLNSLLHLTPDADEHDIGQIFDLAGYFADDGDAGMRDAITQKFLSNPALGSFAGAREIITLDELDGFIFVAEYLSEHLRQYGPDFAVGSHVYHVDQNSFWWLEGKLGPDQIDGLFQQLRTDRPTIIPVLDAIDMWRKPASPKRRHIEHLANLTYAEIKQNIENPAWEDVRRSDYRQWAKGASEADLYQAAQDLVAETDPTRLENYLALFADRPFPLEPDKLFGLIQKKHRHVTIQTVELLVQMNHPSVRAFALANMEQGWMVGRVVSLLQGSNYQESDWAIIEPLTRQVHDEDDYHDLGLGVCALLHDHSTPLAIQSLINLYEHGPCSYCREHLVDYLADLNAIPDWLREEARYDSNYDVRDLIRQKKTS